MVEIRTCSNVAALLGLALLASAFSVRAQERRGPTEAARHFDRGYLLAQQGSLEPAIAEFEQAYVLSPHPAVLYNLGQAFAASGRAVQAVQTLRRYLEQTDPKLDAERRKHALSLIDYQSQRIGALALDIVPAGAELILDGVVVGKAPLAAPIAVTAGTHGLTVAAPGFVARHERVDIAAKSTARVELRLEPTGSAIRLKIGCRVPDVRVLGDGQLLATLPRGGELVLHSAPKELRFERDGFLSQARAFPADVSAQLDCELLAFDSKAKLAPVSLESPPGIEVAVNGLAFRGGSLPLGQHIVTVSGPGIEATEQAIQLEARPGLRIPLATREPGTATALEREQRRRIQRTSALIVGAAGLVSAGTAGVLYGLNQGGYRSWRHDSAELTSRMRQSSEGVTAAEWNQLLERENTLRNRDTVATGCAVLGGALLAGSAALWLSAPALPARGVTLQVGKTTLLGFERKF